MKPEDFFSENNVPQQEAEQPFEIVSSPSQKIVSRDEKVNTALGIEKPKGILSGVRDTLKHIATGVAASEIKTAKGIGDILGLKPTPFGEKLLQSTEETDAGTLGKTVGNVVGTVAPYLTGLGEAEGVALAGKMLPTIFKKFGIKNVKGFIPKMIEYLTKQSVPAAVNTGIGAAQSGDVKTGIETGVGGEVFGVLAKALGALGKGIYKMAIPTSATEAKLLQSYKANVPFKTRIATAITGDSSAPITQAETAFNKALMGTESMVGVQAKKATKNLWKEVIAPALKRQTDEVDMNQFFDEVAETIKKENPELTRQSSLMEGLDALREEYTKHPKATFEQLQDFKQGWAQFVPDKAYRGKPIAGAFNDVRNTAASTARQKIYDAVGDEAKQAYLDYGNLLGLQEWGQRAMTGGKFKGGSGGFISAIKDAVLTPVATVGGMTVYKTAEGIEFIAPAGARYVADLFNE